GPYFGKIGDVASNDQSSFLPASAESTQVSEELKKFQDESSIPAIIVFSDNEQELSQEAITQITAETKQLSELEGAIGPSSPAIVSEDKKAAFVLLNMDSERDYQEFIQQLKQALNDSAIETPFAV